MLKKSSLCTGESFIALKWQKRDGANCTAVIWWKNLRSLWIWYSIKSLSCLYTLMISTCRCMVPRSLSSPCIDGENMLCGRIGLIGLGPTGLDGAYEKNFGGETGIFCYGNEGMNKNCEIVWSTDTNNSALCVCVCVCVLCVYLYLWLSVHRWALPLRVIQSGQRLQDIRGDESYLVEAILTLPPFIWHINDLKKKRSVKCCDTFGEYIYFYRWVANSNYGYVPLVFLLGARRARCCF